MAFYPSSTPTLNDLYVAVDNFSSTLNGAIDAIQTTITLVSTVGLPTAGILTIDSEKIHYGGIAGNDLTSVTRGFSSTSAAAHTNGATVSFNVVEEHHNVHSEEIIAIATDLRTAISGDLDDAASVVATAASLKVRLDQIVTQLNAINTGVDWKDAITKRLVDLVALDGSRTLTGNLPVGGFKLTGLGAGTTNGDSVRYEDADRIADAQTITGAKTFQDQKLLLQEAGGSDVITVNVASLGASRAYTIPDAGASALFVLTEGAQTINGAKTFSDLRGTLGANLAAGGFKLTGLAAGTANGESVRFEQLKYLQAPIQGTTETQTSTTSSTFQATALAATITPSSTASRIKITLSGDMQSTSTNQVFITIKRDSTDLGGASGAGFASFLGDASTNRTPVSAVYIDSPATTSPVTYTVYVRNSDNTNSVSFPSANLPKCAIVLEEVV